MNKNSSFKHKMAIPISKRNKNSYIIIINILQNLNRLLIVLKEKITHSWWSLHAQKPKKKI